jgi:hypothetical protein
MSNIGLSNGTWGAVDNSSECVLCIRGGWVWCSAQWNYIDASSSYSGIDKGKCCYRVSTESTDITNSTTTANIT